MSDFYLIASKLAGFFLNPLHILAILVGLATLCHWLRQLRTPVNTMLFQWASFLGLNPPVGFASVRSRNPNQKIDPGSNFLNHRTWRSD